MALGDDIRALRDQVLADLNAAHDYYTDTKSAWDLVAEYVVIGKTFAVKSMTTGTETTPVALIERAQGYVAGHLPEATFQQFISIFEHFFFELLRLWLRSFPQNLLRKKVEFKDVLDAPDKDAITLLVVNKELNEILYKRPADWFAYLEELVKLGCPTADDIERIAEAKASRDVLAHNRGIASKTYVSKAGKFVRYTEGKRIDIPEPYHRQTWELIRKVVTDVSNAAIGKAP
jgi:hypothetical protein